MESSYPPKPPSLHYATLSMLGGMVLEIVGIGVYSLRHFDGLSGILLAYVIMALTAFWTVRYVVELEKGKLRSISSLVIGMLAQVVLIILIMYFGYGNPFFIAAIILDIIGTALLFYPSTIWWIRATRRSQDA